MPIILLGLLQYALWTSSGGLLSIFSLQARNAAIDKSIDKLQSRNLQLAQDIYDLRTGVAVLEINAREELGMVKPGEKFYRVVSNLNATQPVSDHILLPASNNNGLVGH